MKEYLEEETCLKVSMKETDKYYEKLPLMYKGRYIFYDMQMVGAKWIGLKPKYDIKLVDVRVDYKLIMRTLKSNCVFLFNSVTFYKKEKMHDEGIPFVIKDKQIYLPFVAIVLSSYRENGIKPVSKISFLTQKMVLVAIYEKWKGVSATEAAKRLEVTRMSASRCFDEIQYLGINILDMSGKTRLICVPNDIETLWVDIKDKLRSPVIKTYALSKDVKLDKLGGISALCEYSMLQDNVYPTYVITKKDIVKSGIREMEPVYFGEDIGSLVLEVGYFINFNNNNIEDPFSIILSLSQEDLDDPRVDLSIKEMLKENVWFTD